MTKYIIKRILLAVLTVFIIAAITFFLMHAVPGGPFNREKALSEATINALNERYGLDRPLIVQFFLYLKEILKGDFGVSLKNGREISAIFAESFPISCKLGLMAVAVALLLGTVLGSFAALMRNKLPDRIIIFLTTLLTSIPSFILATFLLLIFCITLGWVPVWSANSNNYVLPVIALAAYPMAYTTRLAKSSMLDALSQDYIRTARAKGVSKLAVIFKHALRNSLIPVRPADRLHHHWLDGHRARVHDRRHRQQVRQRDRQQRLHADHGDDHFPRGTYGRGDADLRHRLQAGRSQDQI